MFQQHFIRTKNKYENYCELNFKKSQATFAHTSKIYFFPIFLQTIDNRRMSNVCDIIGATL